MKKIKVNKEDCICCGACAAICPTVFEIDNAEGYAHCVVDQIPEELEEEVMDALESCPTSAIVEDTEEKAA